MTERVKDGDRIIPKKICNTLYDMKYLRKIPNYELGLEIKEVADCEYYSEGYEVCDLCTRQSAQLKTRNNEIRLCMSEHYFEFIQSDSVDDILIEDDADPEAIVFDGKKHKVFKHEHDNDMDDIIL